MKMERRSSAGPASGKKTKKRVAESDMADISSTHHSAKKSKKESSKRRSSFVAGRTRRSLITSNSAVSDLHKKVTTDAKVDERLRMLKEACFEYSMHKLEAEFPELCEKGDFLKEVQTSFSETLKGMSQDGTLNNICTPENKLPNPLNDELEQNIDHLKECIEKFKTENKKWEDILRLHHKNADEAESMLSGASTSTIQSSTLSFEQRKALADLPDLGKMYSWLDDKAKKLTLQIDQIALCSRKLKSTYENVETTLNAKIKDIDKTSFSGYVDVSKPEELIKGALK